jgi:hypothetical protein
MKVDGRTIYLEEVVIGKDIDLSAFMRRVKEDTGFYKSFKNLRVLRFQSINDIRMLDQRERQKASLYSITQNEVEGSCRKTKIIEEKATGDFYNEKGSFNYYTASLYASLFYSAQKVCGESNLVGEKMFDVEDLKGMEKHKEMLKMLFFQPGKSIPGLPGIGHKLGVFDPPASDIYEFRLRQTDFNGERAYLFTVQPKSGLSIWKRNKIVLREMKTWLAAKDFAVLARTYQLRYDAGVYDFDVSMEVQLQRFKDLVVPVVIRYAGNWDIPFKKREIGLFTATLSGFSY